jgi:hypothetical protein
MDPDLGSPKTCGSGFPTLVLIFYFNEPIKKTRSALTTLSPQLGFPQIFYRRCIINPAASYYILMSGHNAPFCVLMSKKRRLIFFLRPRSFSSEPENIKTNVSSIENKFYSPVGVTVTYN